MSRGPRKCPIKSPRRARFDLSRPDCPVAFLLGLKLTDSSRDVLDTNVLPIGHKCHFGSKPSLKDPKLCPIDRKKNKQPSNKENERTCKFVTQHRKFGHLSLYVMNSQLGDLDHFFFVVFFLLPILFLSAQPPALKNDGTLVGKSERRQFFGCQISYIRRHFIQCSEA